MPAYDRHGELVKVAGGRERGRDGSGSCTELAAALPDSSGVRRAPLAPRRGLLAHAGPRDALIVAQNLDGRTKPDPGLDQR